MAMAAFAAAALHALFKGCFALRHSLRANSYDFGNLLLKSPIVPGVSVVLAAPDASPESRALLRRLLDLTFGRHEVVLVLDGPSGRDLDCWVQEFHLSRQERAISQDLPTAAVRGCYVSRDPIRLLVVDKEPGGVADACNSGVNAAQYPVIGLVDREADFIPEVLLFLIRPMLGDWDHTIAVCGVALPPPATGLPGRIGGLESLRLWLARCAAFSAWNRLLPVPGACMLVRRDAVCSVGGFRAGALELFLDLHDAPRASALGWHIAFLASPVCFKRAAGTWNDLHHQALADQQQLAAGLRRSGAGGGRRFLGLYCIRALRPLVETAACILAVGGWVTGMVDPALAVLVLVMSAGAGIVTSMAAVVLRELAEPSGMAPGTIAALFLCAIPENLGYRQIRNLWMIAGFFGSPAPKTRNRGRTAQDRAPAKKSIEEQ
jgi:GT2 family glycosyltransferase